MKSPRGVIQVHQMRTCERHVKVKLHVPFLFLWIKFQLRCWMQQHPTIKQPSRPFLKWAGGKQRLLSQPLPLLPTSKRLIEPFVGAGSLFLSGRYSEAVLNDAHPDRMALWTFIKERPAKLYADASHFFCEENRNQQSYARLRQELTSATDRYERAL